MPDPNDKPDPLDEDLESQTQVDVPDDTAAKPQTIDLDEEDAVEKEMKSLDNKAFAAMRKEATDLKRQNAEMQQRMQEYEARARQPQQAPAYVPPQQHVQREMIGGVPVPQNKAEWDALARQDWQTAVDLRSIISARNVQAEVRRVDHSTRQMEESKQRVLSRHPELNDASTEKGQIYLSVLDKNPEYLTMSKGPILAMRDMEEEMEARGFTREQIFDSKQTVVRGEAQRVSRTSLTAGGRMPEKQNRTVTLSKSELEFCEAQGLDPKRFAAKKLEQEQRSKGAQL